MPYRNHILTACVGLVLLLASYFSALSLPSSLLTTLIEPVVAAEGKTVRKSASFVDIIVNIRNLARENAELHKRNHELEAEISKLKEVEHENHILRDELNFSKEAKTEYIPAQLLGQTPTGIVKDFIIDKGSRDGIVGGSAVVAHGYMIGIVKTVTTGQSTVRLITHPRSMIPVITQDSRAHGLLRGGIGGLTISDVLIDQNIKSGETVVTSGLGGALPSGLAVGKLVEVTAKSGDITKHATLTSPVDISRLEVVFIRRGGG